MPRLTNDLHIGRPGSKRRESGSEKDANISNVHREVEPVKDIVDHAAGRHQTRIDGASDDTAKRVPCCRVKPVPEFLLLDVQQIQRKDQKTTHVESFRS